MKQFYNPNTERQDFWMSSKFLAKKMEVHPSTLNNLCRAQKIPHETLGNPGKGCIRRFALTEILRWFEAGGHLATRRFKAGLSVHSKGLGAYRAEAAYNILCDVYDNKMEDSAVHGWLRHEPLPIFNAWPRLKWCRIQRPQDRDPTPDPIVKTEQFCTAQRWQALATSYKLINEQLSSLEQKIDFIYKELKG